MYAALQRQKTEAPADIAAHKKPESVIRNQTGLPDQLKSGIEGLSGLNMDRVRVHYRSSNPGKLQALAYVQGTDIHVAPGQEHNLSHEAWHVVQQMQGRVRPTMRIGGIAVNEDPALEHEADVMGRKALQGRFFRGASGIEAAPKSCLQARLPVGVFWSRLYRNIRDDAQIEPGRHIRDSKALIEDLNRFHHGTEYYKAVLENDNGLRRLAYDIKQVKGHVKEAQRGAGGAGAARYREFAGGSEDSLRRAQHLINNKIKSIENQRYRTGGGSYINEENVGNFYLMKQEAGRMLIRAACRNEAYLSRYFNPLGNVIPPNFYNDIRRNFQKIYSKLPIIGFKNNYSEESGTYAYVYNNNSRQPMGTTVGGADAGDTFIRSKQHNGRETGLQIRLSSAYRLAPQRGGDSKAGVIVHEASHLILGTQDHAYGRRIYRLTSNLAENNADTYEYAAENA